MKTAASVSRRRTFGVMSDQVSACSDPLRRICRTDGIRDVDPRLILEEKAWSHQEENYERLSLCWSRMPSIAPVVEIRKIFQLRSYPLFTEIVNSGRR